MATVKSKDPAAPTKEAAVRKFSIEKLRENCRQLFGVSTSTFDGVTYRLTGKYTIDEMKARIDAWEKKGVK